MNLFKDTFSYIEQVTNWGTNNLVDIAEIKRVKAINFSLLVGILSMTTFNILYAVINLNKLYPVIAVYSLFFILFFVIFYLNKNENHLLAKLLFNIGVFVPTFIHSVMFSGSEPGFHYYFLLYALLPVLYWSLKDWHYIIFFLVINLLTFIYVEFICSNTNLLFPFPESSLLLFRSMSMILSFLTIALLMLLYQYQVENQCLDRVLNNYYLKK